ncbi:hypothetical protein ACMGE7_11745 [Macrococcus equi]|uniref:hypothetical protein n=1 Tax=Macrococcus equi TaxID=3395462 RepID=UPI0039BE56F4
MKGSIAFLTTIKTISFFYVLIGMILIPAMLRPIESNTLNILFIAVQILFTYLSEPLYVNTLLENNQDKNKKEEISSDIEKIEIQKVKLFSGLCSLILCFIYAIFSLLIDKEDKTIFENTTPSIIALVIVLGVFLFILNKVLPNKPLKYSVYKRKKQEIADKYNEVYKINNQIQNRKSTKPLAYDNERLINNNIALRKNFKKILKYHNKMKKNS